MWAYASTLPQKEYTEWIEDGSTMTEVKIGLGPPILDKFIKSPGPWVGAFCCVVVNSLFCAILYCLQVVISLWAFVCLCRSYGTVSWALQSVSSIVAVLFCIVADLMHNRLGLPPRIHFILFGAGRKFNKTDWNPTPLVPLAVLAVLAVFGGWTAMLAVTGLQVLRANRMFKKLT